MKKILKMIFIAAVLMSVMLCSGMTASAKKVKVKSINVSNIYYKNYTMKRGAAKKLKIAVSPQNATNKKYKLKSSDPKIVSCKNGRITANKKGTATVKITAADKGGASVKLKVTVGTPVNKINVDFTSVTLVSGRKKTITASALPANASDTKLRFTTSDKAIASVNKSGRITAKKAGTAYVTVRSNDSAKTRKVTVKSKYQSYAYTLKKDDKINAAAIAKPDWINSAGITYSTSNKNVATVSKTGKITGKQKGKAVITLTLGYRKAMINLTVGIPVNKIVMDKTDEIYMNTVNPYQLDPVVKPDGASDKTLVYTTSNKKIAAVSKTGQITGVKQGTAVITAVSADGGASSSITVNVYPPSDLIMPTQYGYIQGYNKKKNLAVWSDVPYAKPPVEELRWRAPADCDSWSGTLKTTTEKKICAQVESGAFLGSEDCLYLNVTRPNTAQTGLPVMVFLHGGSNMHGSKDGFNSENLVIKNNMIVVTINYRLGAFGFFSVDALKTGDPGDDSGNYAMLDIKKSLEWVRDNIGEFGGDKDNVTLMGFSAGSKNVAAAMISPLFKDLYHKAILLSGGPVESTQEEAQKSALEGVASALKRRGEFTTLGAAREWISSCSADELKQKLYSLTSEETARIFSTDLGKVNGLRAHITDGYVLPADGNAAVARGEYNKVPMIVGSCTSEFSGFLLGDSYFGNALENYTLDYDKEKATVANLLLYYGNRLYAGYNLDMFAREYTGTADSQSVYAYRFAWGDNAAVTNEPYFSTYIGAHHGMDIDFIRGIFGNNYKSVAPSLFSSYNSAGRFELSDNMIKYFGNFMKTGDPNGAGLKSWGTWAPLHEQFMMFDADRNSDISYMSNETYDNDLTWRSVNENVGQSLIDTFFKNKFFALFEDIFRALFKN